MTKLAKIAALATIVGTIFTLYVYYNDGNTLPIISRIKENVNGNGTKQSVHVEDRKKSYCEILIGEINSLPSADLNELKVRHKAAKEILYSKDQSDALFDVVKICLKNQRFDYAANVAKDILYSQTQSEAYRAIAVLLAYNGQFENAITVAKKILYSKTQSIALKEISTIRKNPKPLDQNAPVLPNKANAAHAKKTRG